MQMWKKIIPICGFCKYIADIREQELILNAESVPPTYHCPSCNNKIKLQDFEDVINHISEIAYDDETLIENNIVGEKWSKRNIIYKVHSIKNGRYYIKVKNMKG